MNKFKNAKLKITYHCCPQNEAKAKALYTVQGAEICQNRSVLIDSMGYAPSYRGPPIAFRGAGHVRALRHLRPRGIFRSSKWWIA